MIRKNLSTMDDKMHKLREDRIKNKPQSADEATMLGVYKVLNTEQSGAAFKKQTASKARAAKNAENAAIGIETRKSSPVKSQRGSSRGGSLSKKMRETTSMAGDMVTNKPAAQE